MSVIPQQSAYKSFSVPFSSFIYQCSLPFLNEPYTIRAGLRPICSLRTSFSPGNLEATHWRRVGAEFGGTEKISWTKIFQLWPLAYLFRKQFPFWPRKFLLTFFQSSSLFFNLFSVFTGWNVIYKTIYALSHASDKTILEILGGRIGLHGPPMRLLRRFLS